MEVFYTIQNRAENPADVKGWRCAGIQRTVAYSIGSSGGNEIKPGADKLFHSRSYIHMAQNHSIPEELTLSFKIAPIRQIRLMNPRQRTSR